jgi:hypothetical protein
MAMTSVAIERFFEITVSSPAIGGRFASRARALLIAWHGYTGSISAAD